MVLLCYVTCQSVDEAEKIGFTLVEEHLAACANIIPQVRSIFRWEGKVTEQNEALLLLKTTKKKAAALEKRVKALHSYETPCICFYSTERVEKGYAKWVEKELK